jgi:hypothetical protein
MPPRARIRPTERSKYLHSHRVSVDDTHRDTCDMLSRSYTHHAPCTMHLQRTACSSACYHDARCDVRSNHKPSRTQFTQVKRLMTYINTVNTRPHHRRMGHARHPACGMKATGPSNTEPAAVAPVQLDRESFGPALPFLGMSCAGPGARFRSVVRGSGGRADRNLVCSGGFRWGHIGCPERRKKTLRPGDLPSGPTLRPRPERGEWLGVSQPFFGGGRALDLFQNSHSIGRLRLQRNKFKIWKAYEINGVLMGGKRPLPGQRSTIGP